jgi:hypothetical protein
VSGTGGGDAHERTSDIAALPPELSSQSLSRAAIILPLDGALLAIAHLTRAGWRLENWEGWVKMRDGGRAKSLAHAGSFALPQDPARAADAAAAGMKRADERWRRDAEYPGAELYYGLTFRAV